jgi:transposase
MNKGYAQSLKEIIGNPIQSVDKYHLFQEANKVIDEVRQISIWGLRMNFVKVEDIPKLGKKIGKKLTKKDLEKLNQTKTKNTIMQKYKKKSECRLQTEQINLNDLINSK